MFKQARAPPQAVGTSGKISGPGLKRRALLRAKYGAAHALPIFMKTKDVSSWHIVCLVAQFHPNAAVPASDYETFFFKHPRNWPLCKF
jgi:hypothetical protein